MPHLRIKVGGSAPQCWPHVDKAECWPWCSAALERGKICVQVFEGSSGYHMQGSGVLFNPNGQKALEAIDPAVLAK